MVLHSRLFPVGASLNPDGSGRVTIAVAMSFNSGVLLCADTQQGLPARIPCPSSRIFQRSYNSHPSGARSIFLVSEPVDAVAMTRERCERALDSLPPNDYTISRMRSIVEGSLGDGAERYSHRQLESNPDATLLALYSPVDRQCCLFRASGNGLHEFAGYDCQGIAGYFGHCMIRDRYHAAESMESLDLTTVFSIATDTVESVRDCLGGCGDSIEIMVMYANGRASPVQRIRRDTGKQRTLALLGSLAGVCRIYRPGSKSRITTRST